jgi:carbon storage regulator
MLVLTRRPGESVIITLEDGTEINIVTLEVNGNQVRTGYTAPLNVKVNRQEIHDRIKQEKEDRAA